MSERTIIIVDDEPIMRLDLSMMLERMGFRILGEAADGFDAVELCRTGKPDIVLMDIKMPVFDGLGAAEQILGEGLSDCVVIISAYYEEAFLERAVRAGVTGYLVKPVESHRLQPMIEVAYAQSRQLRAAKEQAEQAKAMVEQAKLIERAKTALARSEGISEADAYRSLQKLSMEKRCPMEVLARTILERAAGGGMVNAAKQLLMQKSGLSDQAAYKKLKLGAQRAGLPMEQYARKLLAGKEGIR